MIKLWRERPSESVRSLAWKLNPTPYSDVGEFRQRSRPSQMKGSSFTSTGPERRNGSIPLHLAIEANDDAGHTQ